MRAQRFVLFVLVIAMAALAMVAFAPREPLAPILLGEVGRVAAPERAPAAPPAAPPTSKVIAERVSVERLGPTVADDSAVRSAVVHGAVLDDWEQPVRGVTVRLFGTPESAVTDVFGRFSFTVAAGTYRPRVDEDSLVSGVYLPPWRTDQRVHHAVPAGFYARDVTVAAGGEGECTLRLFHAARVAGRVLAPDGAGVGGAAVRLQCTTPGLESLTVDAVADGSGRFVMTEVYPQSYRVKLWLDHAAPHHRSLGRPVPREVEIGSGMTTLDDLVLGTGTGVVRGRVVNQSGAGCADLSVLCYPGAVGGGGTPHGLSSLLAQATTDAQGRFELTGLPARRVVVAVAPHAHHPYGQFLGKASNRLARRVDPIEIDLAGSYSEVELPQISAIENDPCVITGEVVLGPKTMATRMRAVVVKLAVGDASTGQATLPLPLNRDGTFDWKFDAPAAEPLEIWFEVQGGLVHRAPLVPLPGQRRFEIYQLP